MNDPLSIDIESRSAVDLKKAGADVYWRHASTSVLTVAWAIGDGEIRSWFPGDPVPRIVGQHIMDGGIVTAWNAGFDFRGIIHNLGQRWGWPIPTIHQVEDSAALAAAMALPRGLDDCATALGVPFGKDKDGYRLMLQMSRVRTVSEKQQTDPKYWAEETAKLQRLAAYCRNDVALERAVRSRLYGLTERERAVFELDWKINRRGVAIDLDLVDKMRAICDGEQARLLGELREATDGQINKIGAVGKIREWVNGNGGNIADLQKTTVADALLSDNPARVEAVLKIRQEAAKSSVNKLKSARLCTCDDGRARSLLLYHGASTGRWAGRLLQPQNFPRPSNADSQAEGVSWIETGDAEIVRFGYGNPLLTVADCLRGIIVAGEGNDLVVADFSSIESRVLGWLSGESWKVDAYRRLDAGEKGVFGIYETLAANIYGDQPGNISKKDPRRQVGKTSELACGFRGGVGALNAMSIKFGLDLADALPALLDTAPQDRIEKAEERFSNCCERNDPSVRLMSEDTWMAAELIKLGWRSANPAVVQFWKEIDDAVYAAVDRPGETITLGRLAFLAKGGFLWLRLPSGRCLCYLRPAIRSVVVPWADFNEPEAARERRPTVTIEGMGSKVHQFIRYPLTSVQSTENVVQAIARDLLSDGMIRVEAAGYPIVLTVHDELIAEVPKGFGDLKEFEAMLCETEIWAAGLPVAAEGYRGHRFGK